jgi:hypothetical protein
LAPDAVARAILVTGAEAEGERTDRAFGKREGHTLLSAKQKNE